ncbi:hypothetical protein WME89_04615 [Sorangium sp. So ce321]|uniref:hypothetical protein n=1 Tax=Sorangium sp. So ce321 TaxID=3133300 RepID=UPI003F62F2C6
MLQLLYGQDFEAEGWESELTGRSTCEGHVAVVAHAPHGGLRSSRGNQLASVVDPLIGLPGIGNAPLGWRRAGHDIAERTPHPMYFSYWFRHDGTYGSGNEGKLFYFLGGQETVELSPVSSPAGTAPGEPCLAHPTPACPVQGRRGVLRAQLCLDDDGGVRSP